MRLRKVLVLSVLLLLGLNVIACSGSLFRNYGRILPSEEADRDMEGGVFHPEIRYYISGSDLYPNALMGLHRDYLLDPSTLWREVPGMTTAMMKEIVDNMKVKATQYRQYQYGFEMSDNQGRPVGVWYSIMTARTFLRTNEDGTLRIDTPVLDVYQDMKGDTPVESTNN